MPSPDAPLPNYRQLMYIGDPDYPLLSASAEYQHARAYCEAGRDILTVRPVRLTSRRSSCCSSGTKQELCPAGDCWPAEVVNFRATGAR